jgi:hypothetical protein
MNEKGRHGGLAAPRWISKWLTAGLLLLFVVAMVKASPTQAALQPCCLNMVEDDTCSGTAALSCAVGCTFCQVRLPGALFAVAPAALTESRHHAIVDGSETQINLRPTLPPPRPWGL